MDSLLSFGPDPLESIRCRAWSRPWLALGSAGQPSEHRCPGWSSVLISDPRWITRPWSITLVDGDRRGSGARRWAQAGAIS